MSDVVIHCPNKVHQKPVVKFIDGERVEKVPNPKILFVCSNDSYGTFKVQCADNRCRKSSEGNGWYEIAINGCGGYAVRELPRKWHMMKPVPFIVEAVS